jgi:hypothetical protein
VLRFIPLFDYQFTLDELSGLNRTRFDSFSELIDKGVKIDAHPALIQILIYSLVKLFGYSTWIIKLPFLLFSLGATIYAYAFGFRNFSKPVGLFAAVIFSFSLVFVFYASIARMYISGVFFSCALLYHFYEIVFQNNARPKHYFFLGCFALLSALNQHINALFALTVCFSGVLFLKRTHLKAYLITCFLTVLAYLPHLPVTLYQLGLGGIGMEQGGWLEPPPWYSVLLFLQLVFGTGWMYLLFLIFVLLRVVFEGIGRVEKKQVFLLLLFLFNYWVVYQYSIHVSPVYQHSVMLFSGVAVILFVSSLLDFKKNSLFYPSLLGMAAFLLFTTYIKKDVHKQTVSTVFEYQFQRTFFYQKAYGAENVYPVFFDADEFMQEMYFQKYRGRFKFQLSADTATQSLQAFNALLRSLTLEVLILSSATPVHAALAQQYFPYLIERSITQANHFLVYSKRKTDKSKALNGDKVLYEAGLHSGLACRFHFASEQKDNRFAQVIDSRVEFPLDASLNYSELSLKEGNYILLRLEGKALELTSRDLEICISVTDKQNTVNYQYASASLKSACFDKDSNFVLTAGTFIGSKHKLLTRQHPKFNFYVWNRSKESVLVKAFKVQQIDYWPEKWGFWE